MLPWIVGIVVVAIILFILDREIYFYEAAHLGPRVQGWLYDRWAAQYDKGKHDSQVNDAEVLAHPLIKVLNEVQPEKPEVFMLDVATGTGRLPVALLSEPEFKGRIVALDLSREMLVHAAEKLAPYADRVDLLRHSALEMPFLEGSFDVVSCMEALELMPNMETPLAELARVLRPGGILLTTRGTEASGRVNKIVATEKFAGLLQAVGFEQIEIIPWWKNFDRVWARRTGQSAPVTHRTLTDVLRCPSCGSVALASSSHALRCQQCQTEIARTPEGIALG
jgi:ubiquinone/menaquinone biosynthesis C-methylase UbiE